MSVQATVRAGAAGAGGRWPSGAPVRRRHLRRRRRPDEAEARPGALQPQDGRAPAAPSSPSSGSRGATRRTSSSARELTRSIREFATTRGGRRRCGTSCASAMYFQAGELTDPAVYAQLADLLAEIAKRHGTGGNVLFYLATPPNLFGEVVRRLGEAGLVQTDGDSWRRVIVEKPFGPRPRLGPRAQRRAGRRPARGPDLPDRPLPRQGDRPEHPGLPLRQRRSSSRSGTGRYVDHVQITVAETVGRRGPRQLLRDARACCAT